MSIRPDEPTFISMMQTHQSAVYNLCYRMLGEAGARVAKSARRAGKGSLPGVSALAPGNEPAYAS